MKTQGTAIRRIPMGCCWLAVCKRSHRNPYLPALAIIVLSSAYVAFLLYCLATIRVPYGDWILGNVNYTGFYRTNYDVEMWKRLIDQLKRDHTVRF